MKPFRRSLVAAAGLLLFVTACGDDTSSADRTTTTAGDSATTVVEAPERIVSLSASATEMLFAIGAGGQVVAVDDNSNYPSEAPLTDLSAYDPNVEAISTYDPDLVVLDAADPDLIAGLEKVGIEVFEAPAAQDLNGTYDQIVALGEATGHADEAKDLVASMQADIAAILADASETDEPLTIYHELDETLYSVTSSTFLGDLYRLAGLTNVADAADAEGQSGGYPQLSAEYLVDADPDLVFLADSKCCAQTPETFAARPGFSELSAVTSGQVILLDDDVASRWGPRVVDLLRQIVDAVNAAVGGEEAAAA